ncbi:MAG: hypothetical protein SGPRY_008797 [Prymnesium sp.]
MSRDLDELDLRDKSGVGGIGDKNDDDDGDGAPQQLDSRNPKYIKEDRITVKRTKPFPPSRARSRRTRISELLEYLMPDGWWDNQLLHTNIKLLGTDTINSKLTVGELKKWWGYALAHSV